MSSIKHKLRGIDATNTPWISPLAKLHRTDPDPPELIRLQFPVKASEQITAEPLTPNRLDTFCAKWATQISKLKGKKNRKVTKVIKDGPKTKAEAKAETKAETAAAKKPKQ